MAYVVSSALVFLVALKAFLHGFLKPCAGIGTGDEWSLQKLGGFVGECGHAGGGCVVGLV